MTKNSPVWLPFMLQRKLTMAWGTTTDRVTAEINHFLYARETKHLTLNDPKHTLLWTVHVDPRLAFPLSLVLIICSLNIQQTRKAFYI